MRSRSFLIWTLLGLSLSLNAYFVWTNFKPKDTQNLIGVPLDGGSNEREIKFIREAVTLYFDFNSQNYLPRQAQLLPLMAEQLQKGKKDEISRLLPQIESSQLNQSVDITRIERSEEHLWKIQAKVHHVEKNEVSAWPLHIEIKISEAPTTYQNVWGFQVDSIVVRKENLLLQTNELLGNSNHGVHLDLPCPVQDVVGLDAEAWQLRIVNTQVSEIHLKRPLNDNTPLTVRFLCGQREFPITLVPSNTQVTSYAKFVNENGIARKNINSSKNYRPERPAWIQKSLKSELGLEVEE